MPKPYSKRARTTAASTNTAGSSPATVTLTITLKPLRAAATGPNVVTVRDQTPNSSIYDVKAACAAQAGYAPDKVKILWERKPVADSKTVKEVVGDAARDGAELEMNVMFMGQPTQKSEVAGEEAAPAAEPQEADRRESVYEDAPIAQGAHGEAVLETEEFWDDLQGFVLQRLRDEEATTKVVRGFRESWKMTKS